MTHDADAPDVLERFHDHLDLVERVAVQLSRTLGATLSRDDLVAAGREGLLDAARRFDADRGVPFGAYATLRVRGAMIDGVRRLSGMPRRAWERVRTVEAVHAVSEGAAEDVFGARPPGAGPAEAEAALDEHLAAMTTAAVMGLITPATGGEQVAPDESPEDAVLRSELALRLRNAADALPDPEGQLLRRHYFNGERFDHVAAELGLSKSWASRLHTRALKKLAVRLRKRE